MKRLFAVLLMISLVFCGAAGLADQALDAAFEADALNLVEVQAIPETLTGNDLDLSVVTDEQLMLAGLVLDRSKMDVPMDAELLSLSPAGNSGVLMVGGSAIGMYNGKYHVLYPSYDRSTEDKYSYMKNYYDKYIVKNVNRLMGPEGLSYSPDGRYVSIHYTYLSLINRIPVQCCPIIVDLSTGEVILTATYNIIYEENGGLMLTDVFSSDGRYYYFLLEVSRDNIKYQLCRYDLQNGITEVCASLDDTWGNLYSRICETGQDSFVFLVSRLINLEEKRTLINLRCENGEWITEGFPLNIEKIIGTMPYLLYNSYSGNMLLLADASANSPAIPAYYTVQIIRPNEDYKGLYQYIFIRKDAAKADLVTKQEVDDLLNLVVYDEDHMITDSTFFPYRYIMNAALSPDGKYLLIHTQDKDKEGNFDRRLFLIRLEDLAVREVHGFDAMQLAIGPIGRIKRHIEWNTDTLIFDILDEGCRTYRFE